MRDILPAGTNPHRSGVTKTFSSPEIRVGLEHWVESSKTDPKVLERAASVRADIERDAETKRKAISSIFGPPAPGPSGSRGRSKQASDDV